MAHSALARAFSIAEIEEDTSLVAEATKECFFCDIDNPRAVRRELCSACGGSGREPLAIIQILEELRESKKEPKAIPGKATEDNGEDLYLEY